MAQSNGMNIIVFVVGLL